MKSPRRMFAKALSSQSLPIMAEASSKERGWCSQSLTAFSPRTPPESPLTQKANRCFGPWVLRASNPWRRAWQGMLALLLIYTASILPYRLCFIEFAIPEPLETSVGWLVVQWTVDGLFWVDLILGFFFSFTDVRGVEVTDWCKITQRYLRGFFVLNFIACLPSEAIAPVFRTIMRFGEDNSVNKSVRLTRLQRISRLARLVRFARMGKLVAFMAENPIWQEIQSIRGVRVLNLVFGLLFAVHLVACGWYLAASLHDNYRETWVARRSVDADGDISLLSSSPELKWAHSMYFVLTVFTTVGFGDMSALTLGEIIYVCITMLVGAVVQSIILSEVINIITSADQIARQVKEQKALVEEFSKHASVTPKIARHLARWATLAHSATRAFDRTRMKELVTSSALPRGLMGQLPRALYDGVLIKNSFLTVCQNVHHQIPPRLPVLVALATTMRHYMEQEVVYFCHDGTWNIFLVIMGTFAHLAKPAPNSNPGRERTRSHTNLLDHSTKDLSRLEIRAQTLKHLNDIPVSVLESVVMSDDVYATNALFLSPYQSFGRGNYFGEAEIFLAQGDTSGSRRSTVRCEASGTTLVLPRGDVMNLVAEFPRSADAWYHAAARRENHRQHLLFDLKAHHSVEDLAASTIQRHVREYLEWKNTGKLPRPLMAVAQRFAALTRASTCKSNQYAPMPQHARRLQNSVDELRDEVAEIKNRMDRMQGSLEVIADALRVKDARPDLQSI